MARPSKLPRWASGVSAQITEPSSGKKDQGWISEQPPHQYFNWLDNLNYLWAKFLDEEKTANLSDTGNINYDDGTTDWLISLDGSGNLNIDKTAGPGELIAKDGIIGQANASGNLYGVRGEGAAAASSHGVRGVAGDFATGDVSGIYGVVNTTSGNPVGVLAEANSANNALVAKRDVNTGATIPVAKVENNNATDVAPAFLIDHSGIGDCLHLRALNTGDALLAEDGSSNVLIKVDNSGNQQIFGDMSIPAANDYKYLAAKTFKHTVQAADLNWSTGLAAQYGADLNYVENSGAGGAVLVAAPLHLPNGTIITNVEMGCDIVAASGASVDVSLKVTTKSTGSAGAAVFTLSDTTTGYHQPSTSTGLPITISNDGFYYTIIVSLDGNGAASKALFYYLELTCTLTTFVPTG